VKAKQIQYEEECNASDSYDDKTSQERQDVERLFKIQPVYEYFIQKFRSIYNPKNCHNPTAGSPKI
jgi:hypothetical protein